MVCLVLISSNNHVPTNIFFQGTIFFNNYIYVFFEDLKALHFIIQKYLLYYISVYIKSQS